MFTSCNYKPKTKLVQHHNNCKSSNCVFACNITSMHFKSQYCFLFLLPFVLCHLLPQNSQLILFVSASNSDISLNRFLLSTVYIVSI